VAAEVALGVLVKVEGMDGAAEADLEVAQQHAIPAELWQLAGAHRTGGDGLMAAARRVAGTEARVDSKFR
jgi:hypothetical protein